MRIGPYELDSNLFLSPLAGYTNLPFRLTVREIGGVDWTTTDLVNARSLLEKNKRALQMVSTCPAEKRLAVQLFGAVPEEMRDAAAMVEAMGIASVDINMGCPVKKVTKTGAGSGLLCDSSRAGEIVRQIKAATGLPVTAKIRSGWDANQKNFLQMADVLGAAGVAALAVHPRTRAQGYSGKADWSVIADLKKHVGNAFPIIGNGDVKSVEDAVRMVETTGCDYVMIGRGALGNPWIFRTLLGGPKPSNAERMELVLRHFRQHMTFSAEARVHREVLPPEQRAAKDELQGVHSFRSHLGWYAHGLHGASVFRAKINHANTKKDVEDALEAFFVGASTDLTSPETEQELDYRTALG